MAMKRLFLALAFSCVLLAQDKVDEATTARIRSEELEHSMIMHTEHMLTDRFGPRMTGTPNHEAAVNWVIQETTAWGMKNAHKEAWDFGHPGWLNERASGFITAPVKENLKFEILAWTPSTKGTVTGSAIQLIAPHGPEVPPNPNAAAGGRGGRGGPQFQGPTQAEMDQWIAQSKSSVRGKMVLVGKAAVIPVDFNPPQKRLPDEPAEGGGRGRGNFGGGGGRGRGANDGRLTARQVTDAIDTMLLANGALVRVNDAARAQGIIVAQQNPNYAPEKTVPTVILRNDDYGRIERLLDDKDDVKLEFNIDNKIFPAGKTSYDVVTEIPGTDKAGEIVMLGGHLDSWHSATGATDNGIGSSIMLEAARLIQALGLKPRRTIRVALWSGEEEGLLGSLAYVKAHFGTFENPKPEFDKLDCYFNVDTGTGRLRGASIFGPPQAAELLQPAFVPFKDWGLGAVRATSSRATGGTDSTSYNNAGLPGIGYRQDPIEYNSMTHHTNLDTYERIIPEDVKEASAEVAAAIWYVANLDQMIPRFTKETMPAPVAAR